MNYLSPFLWTCKSYKNIICIKIILSESDSEEQKMTTHEKLTSILTSLTSMTAVYLPDDIEKRVRNLRDRETDKRAISLYDTIIKNIDLAESMRRPVCQDTGMLQYFVEAGTLFPYLDDIRGALTEAAESATLLTPLRPNAVDPFTNRNTGTNTGAGAPYIHFDLKEKSSDLTVRLYMAGGGCSLPGRACVLMPLEGLSGIKKFIYETVIEWGINACPPLVLGVGIGTCAVTAAELSKKALLRPLDERASEPDAMRLEDEIKEDLDRLGIAPLGFGGSASVLGVNVEYGARHPATLGVGLSFGCWATRRSEIVIHSDLSYDLISHKRNGGGFIL